MRNVSLLICFQVLLLPISFYPVWAQDIMKLFPFQAISYIPSMIFTEGIQGNEVLEALLFQVILGNYSY